MQYILPEGGQLPGSLFGYGVTFPLQQGTWSEADGSLFDLSSVADNIFVYCIDADNRPVFLNAITYGSWGLVAPSQDTDDYAATTLPPISGWGSLALPWASNFLYTGPKTGTKTELLTAFAHPGNYQGSLVPYTIDNGVTDHDFASNSPSANPTDTAPTPAPTSIPGTVPPGAPTPRTPSPVQIPPSANPTDSDTPPNPAPTSVPGTVPPGAPSLFPHLVQS